MKRVLLSRFIFPFFLISTLSAGPILIPLAGKHQDAADAKAVTFMLKIEKGKDLKDLIRKFDNEVSKNLDDLTNQGWQVVQVTPTQFMWGEDLVITYLYTLRQVPIRR